MSSRGQVVAGTDGSDFGHRQKVAKHYETSVENKYRLKWCIFLHFLLTVLMLVKLSDDILDRLDIFILSLQELYIPKPRLWEWMWSSSIVLSLFAMSSFKNNNMSRIRFYAIATFLWSLCPILYALVYYSSDIYAYIASGRDISSVKERWMGLSVAIIWYAFCVVALQVHIGQLFFAIKLWFAWNIKKVTKKAK